MISIGGGEPMKHNRVFSVYTPVVFSAFLFLSVLCSNETRAGKYYYGIGKLIAGTYLLTEDTNGGSRIVTITADGNWFGIHSFEFDDQFSNQQGVWKKTGRREITVRTLDFNSSKELALFSFTVEFDKSYQQISGELSGKIFSFGDDPLDPNADPKETLTNTFTGKRLRVTD